MFSSSNNVSISGGNFTQYQVSKATGLEHLASVAVVAATHDSGELFDRPQCHPNTREAVLKRLMDWVVGYVDEDKWMLWLYGGAGAGKSTIGQTLALCCVERKLLLGSFFFSRADPQRSTMHSLAATLAYQAATTVPELAVHIAAAVERDPLIFGKTLAIQLATLLIDPINIVHASLNHHTIPYLIIVDGLDECLDSKAQCCILEVFSAAVKRCTVKLRILVASRAEPEIKNTFNCAPLQSLSTRFALDNAYKSDDDIRLFLTDTFEAIKAAHQCKAYIPPSWPSDAIVSRLVQKSSGQFIYASTVAKYISSARDDPVERLQIILGLRPRDSEEDLPFAQLDVLYFHILSAIPTKQVNIIIHILALLTVDMGDYNSYFNSITHLSEFFSLPAGKIELLLSCLSAVLEIMNGYIYITHASLRDYLFDEKRSKNFFIDETVFHAETADRCARYVVAFGEEHLDSYQSNRIAHFLAILNNVVPFLAQKGYLTEDIRRSLLSVQPRRLWFASEDREYLLGAFTGLSRNKDLQRAHDITSYFTDALYEYYALLLASFKPNGPEVLLTTLLDFPPADYKLALDVFGVNGGDRLNHYSPVNLLCLESIVKWDSDMVQKKFYHFLCDARKCGPYALDGTRYATAAFKAFEFLCERDTVLRHYLDDAELLACQLLPLILNRSSRSTELISYIRSGKIERKSARLVLWLKEDFRYVMEAGNLYLKRTELEVQEVEKLHIDSSISPCFLRLSA